ncbi:MAG: FAD-containing oxidoreductase [Polyangiaceae bacterium]|nr:FAD-containing oxidoreductase [Polyangiaceae bacterium]
MKRFDAIVIGAGQSGPPLAARLAGAGMKVALVERRRLGGTCVNDGCIPTKTLVASARAAWVAKEAERYGVVIQGAVGVDMKKVKARKDQVVKESLDGLEEWMTGTKGLTMIHGQARFESPNSIRVGDDLYEADKFYLDVGGRAVVPDEFKDVPYLTNSSMMDIDFVPEHLVIVGGSYVGLEFAQMYRRFGSRVTVIEHGPRLVSHEDDDVADGVRSILENEGIEVQTSTKVVDAKESGGRITLKTTGPTIEGSHVLLAVGRKPNTGDLGLDRAGVTTNQRGIIEVDDRLTTSAPHIWALGDVNGRGAFTHTSYNDYEIVAANLLDNDPRRVTDRITIYALFIDPPLGRVGMSERQAKAAGHKVLVGKRPMTRVGRARERGETQGFIKILVDADTKLILGAAILGIEGDEVIHVIADVMYAKAPYTVISRAVHLHPTVSELLPTTLQTLEPA